MGQRRRARRHRGRALPSALEATRTQSVCSFFASERRRGGSSGQAFAGYDRAAAKRAAWSVQRAKPCGGDAGRAIGLLAQARERFPGGVLGQERAALGVEALMQSGARAEAAESARRFLAAFPNSPHAARVRALVAASPAP